MSALRLGYGISDADAAFPFNMKKGHPACEWCERPELLAGNNETRRHAKYPRLLAEYAQLYRTTSRAIKRWIQRGKQVGDLPPLGNPSAMRRWLAGRMRRNGSQIPENFAEQPLLEFDNKFSAD